MDWHLQQVTVHDESEYFQAGFSKQYDYMDMNVGELQPSRNTQWPNNYKFTSISLQLDKDLTVIER